jgi:hypothetical protein
MNKEQLITISQICVFSANPNPCQLPMSTGEGFARLDRFFYDPASKSCKSFIYKGLKGNQNNFLTLVLPISSSLINLPFSLLPSPSQRSCQLACLPLDSQSSLPFWSSSLNSNIYFSKDPCIGQPAKTPSGQILFCSSTNRDTCPVNFWCHLGAIPETTVCCPGGNLSVFFLAYTILSPSFQQQIPVPSLWPRERAMPDWPDGFCSNHLSASSIHSLMEFRYYNADERQCVSFQYNGKRGNQNNFLTQDECQNMCPGPLA